ncbi:hypothetical protein TIFTF001_040784 [Ficus carica]|uniref:Peptidase A2 domain-containing protein n=1 Tax=Ficus carica TaxID=3494 RepID=A0AA88D3Q2_FICCA|nr:hypothetical protein TIFTF001_040784 [Ficus carica]
MSPRVTASNQTSYLEDEYELLSYRVWTINQEHRTTVTSCSMFAIIKPHGELDWLPQSLHVKRFVSWFELDWTSRLQPLHDYVPRLALKMFCGLNIILTGHKLITYVHAVGLQHAGEGQPQEAIDWRIAKLMAENEELRIRFNVSTSSTLHYHPSLQPLRDLHIPSQRLQTSSTVASSRLRSSRPISLQAWYYHNHSTELLGPKHSTCSKPSSICKISCTELLQVQQDNRFPRAHLAISISHACDLYAEGVKRRHLVQAFLAKPQRQRHQVVLPTRHRRKPKTVVEASVRAQGLIKCEGFNKKLNPKGLNINQRGRQGKQRTERSLLLQPKYALDISPERLMVHLQDHGHLNVDCKALHCKIVELLKQGHLKELLSDKGRQTYGIPKDRFECDKRRSSETPSPPPTKKTIGVVLGGSGHSSDLVDHIISLHEKKATKLCRSHDVALVITLLIANCQVGRILVDNGSSADILFLTALKEMDISKSQIEKAAMTLVGFNGKSTQVVGKIQLHVFVGGENKLTTFFVMDSASIYIIILSHQWIHSLKAVPSTYHQVISFSTKRGIREINGNQVAARGCYLSALKLKSNEL